MRCSFLTPPLRALRLRSSDTPTRDNIQGRSRSVRSYQQHPPRRMYGRKSGQTGVEDLHTTSSTEFPHQEWRLKITVHTLTLCTRAREPEGAS
ncbi:hypothetical protein LshimejAT787_0310620 [Lyophyllum shimeji]|uniref:Uncharacterized protein n=1 Tax=Lyophyllum shimeji TaxID=47721 RepID=A0A9P3UMH5_LYOSH|nr:hypothetical protein LshimejAT787_0310620 [Lyophyllum shimeji]